MSRRGFSLAELAVALTLGAMVVAAGVGVPVRSRRTVTAQLSRLRLNQEARAAMFIIADEVRELDAADPGGSDILDMAPGALTYRASRGLWFLCRPADTVSMRVTVAASPAFGEQGLPSARGPLLAYVPAPSPGGSRWLRLAVPEAPRAAGCPGGRSGWVVPVSGIVRADLARLEEGTPVRGQEAVRIQVYADADNVHWLGMRTLGAGGSWGDIQPFAGPVAPGGLELAYYDTRGLPAADARAVSAIGIAVTARSGVGAGQEVRLSTVVWLRNSRT